jgi:hypothetical protein
MLVLYSPGELLLKGGTSLYEEFTCYRGFTSYRWFTSTRVLHQQATLNTKVFNLTEGEEYGRMEEVGTPC